MGDLTLSACERAEGDVASCVRTSLTPLPRRLVACFSSFRESNSPCSSFGEETISLLSHGDESFSLMTPREGAAELWVAFLVPAVDDGTLDCSSPEESCFVKEDSDVRESFESSFRTFGRPPDGFLAGCREVIKQSC